MGAFPFVVLALVREGVVPVVVVGLERRVDVVLDGEGESGRDEVVVDVVPGGGFMDLPLMAYGREMPVRDVGGWEGSWKWRRWT